MTNKETSKAKTTRKAPAKKTTTKKPTTAKKSAAPKKTPISKPVTQICVRFDVGFNNTLYLRGSGADLSWDHGVPLKNVGPDEWIWETNKAIKACEFKVLVNDELYELGENHQISKGEKVKLTPVFPGW